MANGNPMDSTGKCHTFSNLLSYGTIHPLDIQDIKEIVTEDTGETIIEYYRNNVYLYTKKFQVPFSGSIQFPEKTIDYYVTPINKMSCTIHYRIEAPDGRVWETDIGLKGFAENHKKEIEVDYWRLFNAYRKCYNNTTVVRKRKDNNNWKVTRLDQSNS